ncbi:MAG: hypothetical protein QOF70_7854 [Acetobacteraceae bacterium]|jgi:hypothetical protein|nr:hypothetical protein [Acetobacteraceae bacterium]
MAVTDMEYTNYLRQARADLQHRLNLFEAGELDVDWTAPKAIIAARHCGI